MQTDRLGLGESGGGRTGEPVATNLPGSEQRRGQAKSVWQAGNALVQNLTCDAEANTTRLGISEGTRMKLEVSGPLGGGAAAPPPQTLLSASRKRSAGGPPSPGSPHRSDALRNSQRRAPGPVRSPARGAPLAHLSGRSPATLRRPEAPRSHVRGSSMHGRERTASPESDSDEKGFDVSPPPGQVHSGLWPCP